VLTASSLEAVSAGIIHIFGNNSIGTVAASTTTAASITTPADIQIEVNTASGTTIGTVGLTSGLIAGGSGGVSFGQYDTTAGGIAVNADVSGGAGPVSIFISPVLNTLGGITVNSGKTVSGTGLTMYTEGGAIILNGALNDTGTVITGGVSLSSGYTSPPAWGNISGLGSITSAATVTLKAADLGDSGVGGSVNLSGQIAAGSVNVTAGTGIALTNLSNTLSSVNAANKSTGNIAIVDSASVSGNLSFGGSNGAAGGTLDVRSALNLSILNFSTNNGNATFVAGANVNTGGIDTALNLGSGRWLIYSTDPGKNLIGTNTNPDFQQFGALYPTAPAQATGNGLLYSVPGPVVTTTLVGTTSKPFDGTATATLTAANYSLSGTVTDPVWVNAPAVVPTLASIGTAAYASAAVGTGIVVTTSGGTANATFTGTGTASGIGTVYGYTLASARAPIGEITPGAIPGVTPGAGGNTPLDMVLAFLERPNLPGFIPPPTGGPPGEGGGGASNIVVEGQLCAR